MIDGRVIHADDGDPTRLSLLARLKADEAHAWEQFAVIYQPLLRLWCRKLGLNTHDADDVIQEVLRAVTRSFDTYEHQSFRGWLWRITVNKHRDALRRRVNREHGHGGSEAQRLLAEVPDTADDEAAPFATVEQQLLVRAALDHVFAGCRDQTRGIFHRHVLDDRTAEEVAAEFNVAVHVVYLVKSRTLKKLREQFAGMLDLERDLLGSPSEDAP